MFWFTFKRVDIIHTFVDDCNQHSEKEGIMLLTHINTKHFPDFVYFTRYAVIRLESRYSSNSQDNGLD
jgi:hypothetical protein